MMTATTTTPSSSRPLRLPARYSDGRRWSLQPALTPLLFGKCDPNDDAFNTDVASPPSLPIFPPTATTQQGYTRGTTLLRPLPHLVPGSIHAASCATAGGGGPRGTSPDDGRDGRGIGGMIRSPFRRLSEGSEFHARKWIQGLIKRVAKTLAPNKDSDKRHFGRCVVMDGIVL